MFDMKILTRPDGDGHRYIFRYRGHLDPGEDCMKGFLGEVHAWCAEQFGTIEHLRRYDQYRGSRWVGFEDFWFRDEEDALQFRLRWC
jgi:hypothetical protein